MMNIYFLIGIYSPNGRTILHKFLSREVIPIIVQGGKKLGQFGFQVYLWDKSKGKVNGSEQ